MSRQATTKPAVKTPVGDAVIEGSQHSWLDLFTPKLLTILKEGYGLQQLRADAIAGLTVAIVALPLSMAIAIASGVSPAQGLYTAIVGGFLVSALGGSRFQIGGPAGAFIVLVGTTVQVHGVDGLILATIISGVILVLAGLLRLGTYVKFIPYPVTVGFTAGIGVIIFTSQLKGLFGLTLTGPEPGPLLMNVPVIWSNLPSIDPTTAVVSIATIVVIVAGDANRCRRRCGGHRHFQFAGGHESEPGLAAFPRASHSLLCRRSVWPKYKPCCRALPPLPC
jgi:SulP family sulfate permease